MFTGIVEHQAEIVDIKKTKNNLDITLSCELTSELKIDQSVSHNGICLTVVSINNKSYTVTAIEETTNKTTIGSWMVGDIINLERAMKIGDRLDGHMIQGHVDQVGKCIYAEEKNGSWEFIIEYKKSNNITVEKGNCKMMFLSASNWSTKDAEGIYCVFTAHYALHSPVVSKVINHTP